MSAFAQRFVSPTESGGRKPSASQRVEDLLKRDCLAWLGLACGLHQRYETSAHLNSVIASLERLCPLHQGHRGNGRLEKHPNRWLIVPSGAGTPTDFVIAGEVSPALSNRAQLMIKA